MAWDEVIGQEGPKRVFQAHLASGTVPNAYLLAGPEGVGKRKLALELAKALNCEAAKRPCDACRVCQQIAKLIHPDVHLLTTGGASDQIKIEDVRAVLGRMMLKPFSARMQVAIVDGAERLTEEAGNALLKLLEEPPRQGLFILMTAHAPHCLPTIVSRCQLVRCQRLPAEAIVTRLVEAAQVDQEAARWITARCDGSLAQAEALAASWAQTQALLARCASASPAAWLDPSLPHTRQEVGRLLDGMIAWLRDLALAAGTGSTELARTAQPEALTRQAPQADLDRCLHTAFELVTLRESLEQFANPRIVSALAREQWLDLMVMGGGRA